MKNTFMTPVHSKVLHTGRHPLVEDVVSQSGLYSLAFFFSSTACNRNTLQTKISLNCLEPCLFYPLIFNQLLNCIHMQDITG